MTAAPRYLFFVWVFIDKVKEWYHLLKGFNWKKGDYNIMFYVLFDFLVYFYMALPIILMVPFLWAGAHKTMEPYDFLVATGACFAVFTYGSVMSKRISEYYSQKIKPISSRVDGEK